MHYFAECLVEATRENSLVFNLLESSHSLSLSHTTLTIRSYNKYRVQKIEHNYNQIWHEIKANKTYSCKLQLYNIYIIGAQKRKAHLE